MLTALSLGTVANLAAVGVISDLSAPYFYGLAGVASHLMWQVWTADVNNRENLWNRFSSNVHLGAFITLAIMAGHF